MAANDSVAPTNPIAGQVLFYQQPEPLDAQRHARLGMMNTDRPFGFAAKQHFIPINVGEFGPASVSFPIIFAGDDRTPLVVTGLVPGENIYIADDGLFRAGVYVPAFIRRYPFVGALDDAGQRTVVCIDRASSLWVEDAGDVRLFENGEPTQYTKNCIEFCSQFDIDRRTTASFVQLLTELDLFETQQAKWTPRNPDGTVGEPVLMSEFFGVSVTKLNALPAAKLTELRDNGALAAIYFHMASLFGWDRVIIECLIARPENQIAANA